MTQAVRKKASQPEMVDLPPELAPFAPFFSKLAELLSERAPAPAPAMWLSIEQAAEYSGLSDGLLRRLVKAGRITGVRDGRWWKVRKADIESFDPAMLEDLPSMVELKKRGRSK